MEIIASHSAVDWDAIASVLAARRLYDRAVAVLPHPQTGFAADAAGADLLRSFNIRRADEIDPAQVTRLVLVATRRPADLGGLAAVLRNADLEIHVFDNSVAAPDDVEGAIEVVRPVGACVTLLIELLADRGLHLSPDEATWALVGLYEKTGGLALPTTSGDDLRAAGRLLDWGADLAVVAEGRAQGLRGAHVTIVHDLLQAARRFTVGHTEVVITDAVASADLADLESCVARVHRLRGGATTIAAITDGERTTILALGRPDGVDLRGLAAAFGVEGSREKLVAATTMNVSAAKETIDRALPGLMPRASTAGDLARGPAPAMSAATTVAAAAKHFLVAGEATSLLTDSSGRAIGSISARTVTRAMHLGLGEMPLGDIRLGDPIFVTADTPLDDLAELANQHPESSIAVRDDPRPPAVLAPAEIWRAALASRPRPASRSLEVKAGRPPSIAMPLARTLPPPALEWLRRLGETARKRGESAYLVGGCVRDTLLGRTTLDLDVVVQGDAPALAAEADGESKLVVHEAYRTATAVVAGVTIDLASARREFYPAPGAPPEVEPASLREDVWRRDFSINTLLASLAPADWGRVVDWCDGQADLRDGRLRVLHGLSFIEDPTRLLRAVRFTERFGLEMEPGTAHLFSVAVNGGFAARVSGPRWWKELAKIFAEANPAAPILALLTRRVLTAVHEKWRWNESLDRFLKRLAEIPAFLSRSTPLPDYDRDILWLAASIADLPFDARRDVVRRIAAPEGVAEAAVAASDRARSLDTALRETRLSQPSQLAAVFRGEPVEVHLLTAALSADEQVKRAVELYFRDLRHIQPRINGDDLAEIGVPQGPLVGQILAALRDARLDGRVTSKKDELTLARNLADHARQNATHSK